MWFLPLLLIGAVVIAAASRSPREAVIPPHVVGNFAPLALPPPGPIDVLDACVRTGRRPPPPVIACAIAEAESIGRDDIADDIVHTFVAPVVYAHEAALLPPMPGITPSRTSTPMPNMPALPVPSARVTYERGPAPSPYERGSTPSPYERGSGALPASPRASCYERGGGRALQAPPRRTSWLPPAASMPPPVPVARPTAQRPLTDEEIRSALNEDPEGFFAMATGTGPVPTQPPAPAPPPIAEAPPSPSDEDAATALAEELILVPGCAGVGVVRVGPSREIFEVRWLRGYPVPALPPAIDGRDVRLVVTDALPEAQPAGLPPEEPIGLHPEVVAQMQEAAGLPEAADQTRAMAPGSPIAGVPDDAWRQFVACLSRESPAYNSSRHVGQFRQRRERLADLQIDPAAILGSAEAQRAALDADLADAHHHALEGGLLRHVGRRVLVPGREEAQVVTLSGLLGVIQCAGLDNAVGWLEKPGDRKRYPNTSQAFLHTNGVF